MSTINEDDEVPVPRTPSPTAEPSQQDSKPKSLIEEEELEYDMDNVLDLGDDEMDDEDNQIAAVQESQESFLLEDDGLHSPKKPTKNSTAQVPTNFKDQVLAKNLTEKLNDEDKKEVAKLDGTQEFSEMKSITEKELESKKFVDFSDEHFSEFEWDQSKSEKKFGDLRDKIKERLDAKTKKTDGKDAKPNNQKDKNDKKADKKSKTLYGKITELKRNHGYLRENESGKEYYFRYDRRPRFNFVSMNQRVTFEEIIVRGKPEAVNLAREPKYKETEKKDYRKRVKSPTRRSDDKSPSPKRDKKETKKSDEKQKNSPPKKTKSILKKSVGFNVQENVTIEIPNLDEIATSESDIEKPVDQFLVPSQSTSSNPKNPTFIELDEDVELLSEKITGIVKSFDINIGKGIISRDDEEDDVIVLAAGIEKPNSKYNKKYNFASLKEGEKVVFDVIEDEVIYEKEGKFLAYNVTGVNGKEVEGQEPPESLVGEKEKKPEPEKPKEVNQKPEFIEKNSNESSTKKDGPVFEEEENWSDPDTSENQTTEKETKSYTKENLQKLKITTTFEEKNKDKDKKPKTDDKVTKKPEFIEISEDDIMMDLTKLEEEKQKSKKKVQNSEHSYRRSDRRNDEKDHDKNREVREKIERERKERERERQSRERESRRESERRDRDRDRNSDRDRERNRDRDHQKERERTRERERDRYSSSRKEDDNAAAREKSKIEEERRKLQLEKEKLEREKREFEEMQRKMREGSRSQSSEKSSTTKNRYGYEIKGDKKNDTDGDNSRNNVDSLKSHFLDSSSSDKYQTKEKKPIDSIDLTVESDLTIKRPSSRSGNKDKDRDREATGSRREDRERTRDRDRDRERDRDRDRESDRDRHRDRNRDQNRKDRDRRDDRDRDRSKNTSNRSRRSSSKDREKSDRTSRHMDEIYKMQTDFIKEQDEKRKESSYPPRKTSPPRERRPPEKNTSSNKETKNDRYDRHESSEYDNRNKSSSGANEEPTAYSKYSSFVPLANQVRAPVRPLVPPLSGIPLLPFGHGKEFYF